MGHASPHTCSRTAHSLRAQVTDLKPKTCPTWCWRGAEPAAGPQPAGPRTPPLTGTITASLRVRETEIHPAPDASLLSQSHCPEGTTESTARSAVLQGGMPWPRSLQQGSGGQSLSQVTHSRVTYSHPGWSHPGVPAFTEWAVSASGVRDSLQTSGSPPCLPSALFILLTGGEA